jgi:hypothetical protein
MRYHVNVFVTQTMMEENWLPSRCLEMDALHIRRYDRYVSKGSIKPMVKMYFVNLRTCFAKIRPVETHVPAFKPHVTILLMTYIHYCTKEV